MRRYAVAVALTMACLLLVANRAKAQVQVTLGPTASGGVVFTGTSGVVSITLGSCSAGICALPGFSATLGGSDHYSLFHNGTITAVLLTLPRPLSLSTSFPRIL